MRIADLAGKRVAVWGYGREGSATLAALRRRLPGQRLSLICSAAEAELARGLHHDALDYVTVEPYAGLLWGFDVVVKSPGISRYLPAIVDALAAGVCFTSATALWFGENPLATTAGVTGTKGKSTVSALITHLLRSLGQRVALAGNIGLPLLELLDTPEPVDCWVVELSSFQTADAERVDVGLVNNIYEEHLDWHGSRERYVSDKLALVEHSTTLVVNGLQPELVARTATHPHRRVFGDVAGWHLAEGMIMHGHEHCLDLRQLPLAGEHNALNLCAALTVVDALGFDAHAALPAVATFRPLPHRLQALGEQGGLTWINDSISTTPQATIEALRSLEGRAVSVLVGGFDRGLDWGEFQRYVASRPPAAVICLGASGARIARQLGAAAPAYRLGQCVSLAEAVAHARSWTPGGGVVLLSPGAPSFDQFRDYADRGRAFTQLAGFDPQSIVAIAGVGIA
ncbi:MAG: UDP-N-acetylmuramoyl-L-alanine--D-glutamate ligase [Rhodanobacteraceae bacterium]|nr:UDP-N-acetylmuramoyl-L-alanine--D-glutamate ligase [Rhodanobacteraceae bacterium]